MAALNASYLVLMDAKSRTDYDQVLAEAAAATQAAAATASPKRGAQRKRAASDGAGATPGSDQGPETRVDVGWLTTPPAEAEHWLKEPRWMLAMVATFALALCALVWVMLQQGERMQFDRSLSSANHGAGLPPDVPRPMPQARGDAPVAAEHAPSAPELTPEQMTKMSDAELLAAMPQVIGNKSPVLSSGEGFSALSGGANHMLDGQPLSLKLAPLQLPERPQ
jgi:hypothetical protein